MSNLEYASIVKTSAVHEQVYLNYTIYYYLYEYLIQKLCFSVFSHSFILAVCVYLHFCNILLIHYIKYFTFNRNNFILII